MGGSGIWWPDWCPDQNKAHQTKAHQDKVSRN